MVKWLVGIFIVLVVLLGGGGVVVMASPLGKQLRSGFKNEAPATEVRMEAAELGDLTRTVAAPGSIEPITLVKISSQVSAKIIALPLREGEQVKKDDVLVRLDPQDLLARLDSAKASMESEKARLGGAEANLINARLSYERFQQLYETGDVTKAELDGAEAQFLSAKSSKQVIEHAIEMAQAAIEQVNKDIENTTITSPIDGVVTTLNAEVGETVIVGTTNNPGSIIMEIADLSHMIVKAQIDETNIAKVKEDQEAKVFINAYDDREYTGKVQKIALKRQVAQDGTGFFETEILLRLEEGERLYSGLTATVEVEVESYYDVVKVPSQAVLDRRVEDMPKEVVEGNELVDSKKAYCRVVYRLVDGKAVATPVEVGPSDLTSTVILKGLEAGEKVVTGPYRVLVDLKHDMRLRDEAEKAKKENAEEGAAEDKGEGADEGEGKDDTDGATTPDDKGDEPVAGDEGADDTASADGAGDEAVAKTGGESP
ncbi:MAG: efflux RND transporter periplasmic adaptor subunit [Phycisphaerales bacterium]